MHRDLLPAPATLAAFAAAAVTAAVSNRFIMRQHHYLIAVVGAVDMTESKDGGSGGVMPQAVFLYRTAAHVGVGVVLLAMLMGLIVVTERDMLQQVLEVRGRRGREVGLNGSSSGEGLKGSKED